MFRRKLGKKGQKAHFGRIFEICSLKGSELPKGHPQRKYKGRSVFQGNQVRDENADHAIFAELGSSPASMEAGKIIDVFGSQPRLCKTTGRCTPSIHSSTIRRHSHMGQAP